MPPAETARNPVLGNYTLLAPIGRGGMGQVYRAQHRRLKRPVAIKMLPPEVLRSPEALARFQREVEVAGRLEHPNIVAAYDASDAGGVHFLVMQYIDGIDLATLVRQHGPLAPGDAVHCLVEAAQGLAHAHERGVVHQDVKPSNLILGRDGTLRILDMGLAWLMPEQQAGGLVADGMPPFMGTADFLAPERVHSPGAVDPRSDIYSLGCTLWYLLAGKAPYEGNNLEEKVRAHREQPIPSLGDVRSDVPASLDRLFAHMVAKEPEDRFQSAGQVIEALEACGVEYEADFESLRADVFRPVATGASAEEASGVAWLAADGASPVSLAVEMEESQSTAPLVLSGELRRVRAHRPLWRLPPVWASLSVLAAIVLFIVVGRSYLSGTSPVENSVSTSFGNDPERRAADWVLSIGGTLQVHAENYTRTVNSAAELPAGPLRIATVQLGGNGQVTDDGLAHLADLKSLEMLWLGNTTTGDGGLAHLAGLSNLRYLGLSRTRVSDSGMRYLQRLKSLRMLRLADTSVSDTGIRLLAPLRELESLNLRQTRITDAGLAELAKLPHLNELMLEGTQVTEAGIRAFQSARPIARISHRGDVPL